MERILVDDTVFRSQLINSICLISKSVIQTCEKQKFQFVASKSLHEKTHKSALKYCLAPKISTVPKRHQNTKTFYLLCLHKFSFSSNCRSWISNFLPQILEPDFSLELGKVTKKTHKEKNFQASSNLRWKIERMESWSTLTGSISQEPQRCTGLNTIQSNRYVLYSNLQFSCHCGGFQLRGRKGSSAPEID